MPIDPYRYLDFASRQIIKAWVSREATVKREIPWTPLAKPLSDCTIALVSTAVLRELLMLLEVAKAPDTYIELPFVWPESPAKARIGSDVNPPIAQLLMKKPWLIPRLYTGNIPDRTNTEHSA